MIVAIKASFAWGGCGFAIFCAALAPLPPFPTVSRFRKRAINGLLLYVFSPLFYSHKSVGERGAGDCGRHSRDAHDCPGPPAPNTAHAGGRADRLPRGRRTPGVGHRASPGVVLEARGEHRQDSATSHPPGEQRPKLQSDRERVRHHRGSRKGPYSSSLASSVATDGVVAGRGSGIGDHSISRSGLACHACPSVKRMFHTH